MSVSWDWGARSLRPAWVLGKTLSGERVCTENHSSWMALDIMLLAKAETGECYQVCDGRPTTWNWSSRVSVWYHVTVFPEIIDDHDCGSCWKSPKQGDLSNQCPRDKCSHQDLGISQKTAICLQGRKSRDILFVKIDYFINRLIEIQAVSSLPGYTFQL